MKKYRVTISKASYRMPRYPAIVSQRYKGKQNLQRVFLSDISIVKYSSMEEAIQKEKRKKRKWKTKRRKRRKKRRRRKKYGWNRGKNPYLGGLGSREIRRLTRPVLSVNHLIEQNLSSRGQRCAGTGKLRIPRWVLLDGFLSETRKFLALNFS